MSLYKCIEKLRIGQTSSLKYWIHYIYDLYLDGKDVLYSILDAVMNDKLVVDDYYNKNSINSQRGRAIIAELELIGQ